MVDRQLNPDKAIKLHEQGHNFIDLISSTDWTIFASTKFVMKSFTAAHNILEGKKYVMISLLVPFISDLRDGLNHALDDLVEIAARKAGIPCAKALVEARKPLGIQLDGHRVHLFLPCQPFKYTSRFPRASWE